MRFTVDTNADDVRRAILAVGAKADANFTKVVQRNGVRLQTQVRANASGRPGPRAPTGDYRRSISLVVANTGSLRTATVGTNAVQSRRLEFGFRGADSLGRQYSQAPLAHFSPAIDKVRPLFIADIKAAVVDAARSVGR